MALKDQRASDMALFFNTKDFAEDATIQLDSGDPDIEVQVQIEYGSNQKAKNEYEFEEATVWIRSDQHLPVFGDKITITSTTIQWRFRERVAGAGGLFGEWIVTDEERAIL